MERYLVTASLFIVALLAMLTWRVRRDAGARIDSRYFQLAGLVAGVRIVLLALGVLAHVDPTHPLFTLSTIGTGLLMVHLLVLFAYSFPDNRTPPAWLRWSLGAATVGFTLLAQNHALSHTAGPFLLLLALMPSYLVLALVFVRRNWPASAQARSLDPVKLVQLSIAVPWGLSLLGFLVLHRFVRAPIPTWIFLAQALLMTLTILGGTGLAIFVHRLFDVRLLKNEVARALFIAGSFSCYVGLIAGPLQSEVLQASGSSALAAMLITGLPPLALIALLSLFDGDAPDPTPTPLAAPVSAPVPAPVPAPVDAATTVTASADASRHDAALGAFAAAVAHDIRTPLTSIQMNVQALRGRVKLDDDDREHLDIALAESHKLKRSVDEMLEYARPIELHPREADPQEIVRDVIDSLSSCCAERGVELRGRPVGAEGPVLLDEDLMRKVLTHLVHNATDASTPRGVVEVAAETTSAHTSFSVRDEGRGISAEHLPRIFEPFFSTRPDSLGLGLTLARKIAHAHGGEIHVESTPSRGTQVTITVPRNAA